MGFTGKVIKCINCGHEFNIVAFQSHYKQYHSDLNDIELAKLHHNNYPKIEKLANEFIEYIFNNKIITTFKEYYKWPVKKFNIFVKFIEQYRPISELDIDTFFKYYMPYKEKHQKVVNSFELCLTICRNNEEEAKDFYEKIIKPKNAYTGHGPELSPWCKEFVGYKNLSEEEKKVKIQEKTYNKNNPNFKFIRQNNNTTIEYYLNKGYDEETAKKLLKERQSTFSLKKCIEKYGEEEGTKRFKQRQEKWLTNYKKFNFSKISQDLFWKIYKNINYNCIFATNNNGIYDESHNKEIKVELDKSYVKLDFYIPELKKWIEFDGDYWHGEKRGNQKRDKIKEEAVFKAIPGIQLKRIRERDYVNMPEKIISECVNWINEK